MCLYNELNYMVCYDRFSGFKLHLKGYQFKLDENHSFTSFQESIITQCFFTCVFTHLLRIMKYFDLYTNTFPCPEITL